jgi:hypothetical protein
LKYVNSLNFAITRNMSSVSVTDVADVEMSDDWKWTVHDQCDIQRPVALHDPAEVAELPQKRVLVFLAAEWDTIESAGTIACSALCSKLALINEITVYCAVPQCTLEQVALAAQVKITLLKPVVPAGTQPSTLHLPLITLPKETTHVISIAGSTSELLPQFRNARPDVKYVILGVPSTLELQHLVSHARKADVVVSVGHGISTELEIAFDNKTNYASRALGDILSQVSPFLLPNFDDGLAHMPKRHYVAIACRQFTPNVQDAVVHVHKASKALKGQVGVNLVGLPKNADRVNAVQAHVKDATFPVTARPNADCNMKTILQQLSMQGTVLLVPPEDPEHTESEFCHAAVFALSKGIPVLVPEGSDTARAIADASVLSPQELARMVYNPHDRALDKKLQFIIGSSYNLDELWVSTRILQDYFRRKCNDEFVPSFLKAISN